MYLPLTNNPEETFSISLFNVLYNFRQLWNTYGFWTLDISDSDGNILMYGIKIVTNENITEQYTNIPFNLEGTNDSDPGRNDLNTFLLEVTEK